MIGTRLILNFSYTNHCKHVDVLFEAQKKKQKQCYHQNVLYVLLENQDLQKNKKKKDY